MQKRDWLEKSQSVVLRNETEESFLLCGVNRSGPLRWTKGVVNKAKPNGRKEVVGRRAELDPAKEAEGIVKWTEQG
jgi:hypothetical protein